MSYFDKTKFIEAFHVVRDAEIAFRQQNKNIPADKMKKIYDAMDSAMKEINRLQELQNDDDIPF